MAIISSIIHSNNLQANGRRHITEIHIDHLGQQYRAFYVAEPDMDINALMLARIPQIDTQLVEAEEQRLIAKFEEEHSNPINYVFQFTTKQAFLRKLIRYIMNHKDIKLIMAIKSTIDWLKATYTATQIANYLGVTLLTLSRINARLDTVFAISDTLTADDTKIEDIP